MSSTDKITTGMIVVGAIAYLALFFLLPPDKFLSFLYQTVAGIIFVSLFVSPVVKILSTGKFEIKEKTLFSIGVVMWIVTWIKYGTYNTAVILFKSILVLTIISVFVKIILKRLEEELP